MFYHYTPFHFYPSPRCWTPYALSTPKESTFSCEDGEDRTSDQLAKQDDAPVIYQDRNVRIQHKDKYTVFSIDMPGIKSSDTKVEIRNGVLSVNAERKIGTNGSAKYAQHFLLKDSDARSEEVHANLSDGVLTITIPKKEETKPIAIPVLAEYAPPKSENDDKDVRFTVDLPGVSVSNVKLEISDDTITLHAERTVFEKVSSIDKYFSVDRTKVDVSAFKAYLTDGVLTITGYLKDPEQPKSITVVDGLTDMTIEDERKGHDEIIVETVTEGAN
jgi:HSP20 family molecular chaperone IbpA